MKALKFLISSVCKHFSLHPARLETLSAMLLGVMNSGNVHHISLSRYLPSTKPKSALRRIERFFQNQVLDFPEYALSIAGFLKFKGKFALCLDRTNWKFGSKNINYLVLSWRINRHVSIPLFAVELDKAGNSNTKERVDLLEQFDQVFGFDRIQSLMADREFIGEVWLSILITNKIPFFIRVKENSLVPYGDDSISIKSLFRHLKFGEYRGVEKEMYGTTVYFAGTKAKRGDLVVVISNQNWKAKRILDQYRKRWSIEEMFKKLKTSGFNWENTHMKLSSRLLTLLIILSIASVLLYCMALNSKIPWKRTLHCPLWSLFKQGMINFQHAAARSLDAALSFLFTSLATPSLLLVF
jgi:hypothetical protein